MSIASWTSPPASDFTFPISRVIRSVSSSLCARRSSAKRKRMLPRSGAGTRRQSSNAAFAFATALSTSAPLERGKLPSTSPVAGATDSNVFVAIRRRLVGDVDLRERSRYALPPAVARHAPLGELRPGELAPAVRPVLAAVDDHRHVRVLAVVLDELLVQLPLQLSRDDAVDHLGTLGQATSDGCTGKAGTSSKRRRQAAPRRTTQWITDLSWLRTYSRAMSGTTLPSSSKCAFHSVKERSSSAGSCPRSASRTGAESAVTRYWYQEMSQAIVTTTSALTPERA